VGAEVVVRVRGKPRRARLDLPSADVRGTIVFVHGSGEATADDFAWYTDQLNELGLACLVVDKVMDGYSTTRRDYDALAADAGEALAWARAQSELEHAPMALLGYSEGSWVATMAAARNPGLVDLVVLCSAPLVRPRSQTSYHWANLVPGRPSFVKAVRRALMWVAMALFTDYGNIDITAALTALPVPVVLVLGEDDPTVDVALALRVFARTRHDSPSPIVVPGSDHALPPDSAWISQVASILVATQQA
jgi:pimeloyl-ACP methyl ester carboxylesterase